MSRFLILRSKNMCSPRMQRWTSLHSPKKLFQQKAQTYCSPVGDTAMTTPYNPIPHGRRSL